MRASGRNGHRVVARVIVALTLGTTLFCVTLPGAVAAWDPNPLLLDVGYAKQPISVGAPAHDLMVWSHWRKPYDFGAKGPTLLVRGPYTWPFAFSALEERKGQYYAREPEFVYNDPDCFAFYQDMQGTGESTGLFEVFGTDWKDGYDTIQWLKNTPLEATWWNGRVGSYGMSALCINQYTYAGENVPELLAQYLEMGSPEQYDHVLMQGGQLRYNMISSWTQQFSGSYEYVRDVITQHPRKDAFWDKRSLMDWNWDGAPNTTTGFNRAANVHAAGVHVGGWEDAFCEGAIAGYTAYNYFGAPGAQGHQVLVMGPWGHGFHVGDLPEFPNANNPPESLDDLEQFLFQTEFYFDRGAGDYNSRWTGQEKVYYYVASDPEVSDSQVNKWRGTNAWPVVYPEAHQQWYMLPGVDQWSGRLQLNPPRRHYDQPYCYDPGNPCPTNGGKNLGDTSFDDGSPIGQGITDQRGVNGAYPENNLPDVTHRDDVIAFVSEPLADPYEFVGKVTARLFVQSNCSDTDFVVKLVDVFPDGREMLLNDGTIRACRVNGPESTTWLHPDEVYQLDVDLWSRAWRFQPGHRIKVFVTSSNYPRYQRNPNRAAEIIPLNFTDWTGYNVAENKLVMAPEYPSYLNLPVSSGHLTPPAQPPAPPVMNPITPNPSGTGEVSVTWQASTGAGGYNVYRDTEEITLATIGSLTPTDVGNQLAYSDTGLTDGTYYYAVTAYNMTGYSDPSPCESVVVAGEPPGPPVLAAITPNPSTTGTIALQWQAVPGATNYAIYRHGSPITPANVGGLTPVHQTTGATTVQDAISTNGTYYYAVVATNASGTSDPSTSQAVTVAIPPPPPPPPAPPATPVLSPITPNPSLTGTISLSWQVVLGATTYYLYRDAHPINETRAAALQPIFAGNAAAHTDPGLGNGTYHYAVRAGNAAGNSSLSACRNVTVTVLPPGPPAAPVLAPITPNPCTTGTINLTWQLVPGATSYAVYRHATNITATTVSALVPVRVVTQTTYVDAGLVNGTYFYAVVARNGHGNSTPSGNQAVVVQVSGGSGTHPGSGTTSSGGDAGAPPVGIVIGVTGAVAGTAVVAIVLLRRRGQRKLLW